MAHRLTHQSQRIAEQQYRTLRTQHLFSQYMMQGQMRDQVFMASLTTFKTELQRIKKTAKLRHVALTGSLTELQELRRQFDRYISTLRKKRLIQFTLPMELALFAVRTQWFFHYQGPQIRQGWQQAGQSFQNISAPENPTERNQTEKETIASNP